MHNLHVKYKETAFILYLIVIEESYKRLLYVPDLFYQNFTYNELYLMQKLRKAYVCIIDEWT